MKLLYLCLTLIFASNAWALEPTPQSPKVDTYDELVHEVRAVVRESKERVEEAVEREKVREAWEIGKLIDEHVLHHKERADYATYVITRLAQDMEMDRSELYRMLQFFRSYPHVVPGRQLSWAHYKALVTIDDEEERQALAEQAEKEHWDRDRLRDEIKWRRAVRKPSQEYIAEPALSATPGKIGAYRVIQAKVGPFAGELALDLGFANYYQPKEIRKFKQGDLVQLQKGKLKPFTGSEKDRYTYLAFVSAVIDGDTFKAVIDLGFNIVTEQTLRLRRLDAREIESKEGKEAKEFLENLIRRSGGEVLIRTSTSDKYDRYLADLWVGETYVNQELIHQGLAVRVTD